MPEIFEIPVERLLVGDTNVRRDIGDISELTASIKDHGVLSPIIVRPTNGLYEIIAGSRRTAAAKAAGLKTVPAIVKHLDNGDAIVESLVENLQRGDLDIEDEGTAYEKLLEAHGSISNVAQLVNKTPTYVGRVLDALSALRKLRPAGMGVEVTSGYAREQKRREDNELLPVRHATVLEAAFRTSSVKESFSDEGERQQKYVELARAIAPLSQRQAERILDRFKATPCRPIPEIRDEVITPVDLTAHLPPDLARQLDETAQARGTQVEDLIPKAVELFVLAQDTEPHSLELDNELPEQHEFDLRSVSELPPLKDLMHSKIIWNLQRLDLGQFDYFTTGYSGRSFEQLVEILKIAGVSILVDVRDHPYSRYRPEFSRNNLVDNLLVQGIEYVHWPDLGIPKDIRDSYSLEDLFRWYDENILPGRLNNLNLRRCAFMCTEVDPQSCHRHRIARFLEEKGYRVFDL